MSLGEKANVGEDKHTGFKYQGKEIVLSKTMGAPHSGIATKPGWYSDEKRIEVATLFAVTGSKTRVEALTGVPRSTVARWLREDWFQSLLDAIRAENDQLLDAKMTEIVVKALDQIEDRVENGDYVVMRDGGLVRKPVGAKDLSLVQAINLDKRQLLRGKPTSRTEQVTNQTVEKKLLDLAENFRKLANRAPEKELDITDVEVISETSTV